MLIHENISDGYYHMCSIVADEDPLGQLEHLCWVNEKVKEGNELCTIVANHNLVAHLKHTCWMGGKIFDEENDLCTIYAN